MKWQDTHGRLERRVYTIERHDIVDIVRNRMPTGFRITSVEFDEDEETVEVIFERETDDPKATGEGDDQ